MLKRKQEYPFLGTNRSLTKYSQNKCFIYLNNKEPENNCAHPEVRKQMATPNTFSSKPIRSVYKSIIYTYGGKLQGHQLLVWNEVFFLQTVYYKRVFQQLAN